MNFNELKRVLTAFADSPADLDAERGVLTAQIRDEVIQVNLSLEHGDVYVLENGERMSAARWLINRVAKLPLLADRIISYVPAVSHFVLPAGQLLDQLEESESVAEEFTANAAETTRQILGRRPPGTTSVLYLTSHAGEGKTSLINHLARIQAEAYRAKHTDWLLVPIPLGGRGFLRFDDVTIAALVNRLRFQFFYYEAFLELVKLGVLVPAFDGFEEMFVEGSSGEAVSALGNLVRSLQSSGSVLVAARKAFFEYRSFRTQARLFDAVGEDAVSFARLGLQRWERGQFVQYAQARKFGNPEELYERVSGRLGPSHPILTRAVLVRRLLDVATQENDLGALLTQVGNTPQDYFFQFVNAIVDREAGQKWLDKSGDAGMPLLSVEEHHELLSMVAQEMWITSSNSLRMDVLDVIAEVYSESKKKPPAIARQIRERLTDHPLLVSSGPGRDTFAFDHEDFQEFYLGHAVGTTLLRPNRGELAELLRVEAIPRETCEHAALQVSRQNGDAKQILSLLRSMNDLERSASFTKDNCAALSMALMHHLDVTDAVISRMQFPAESLAGRRLRRIAFNDCYFQPSSVIDSEIVECEFNDCKFERLEVASNANVNAILRRCEVLALYRIDRDDQLYDPETIGGVLSDYGFKQEDGRVVDLFSDSPSDDEIDLVERVLRIFMRTNHANENVIKQRLGVKASIFFDEALPLLIKHGVLKETAYHGSGSQRRYRLGIPMQDVQSRLSECGGNFQTFLTLFYQ